MSGWLRNDPTNRAASSSTGQKENSLLVQSKQPRDSSRVKEKIQPTSRMRSASYLVSSALGDYKYTKRADQALRHPLAQLKAGRLKGESRAEIMGITPTTTPTDSAWLRRWLEAGNNDDDGVPPADVQILTTRKRRIPAHSSVLGSASPVFESLLERPQKRGGHERVIPILGVPYDAVCAFVRLLYSSRCAPQTEAPEETAAKVGEHGVHLLVLSHVFQVAWMKRACERALASQLAAESVVDVLVLARRCDAPWLHLRCMKLIAADFAAVERSEAWRFLQDNDPALELDILQSLQDAHTGEKRRRRRRQEHRMYAELGEAMECLQHICTEGCGGRAGLCPNPATCRGLHLLARHLDGCDRKKKLHGGCTRCKRLWQLLRLHAWMCDQAETCRVPLCSQFKKKMEETNGKEEEKDEADKWRLLAKKVAAAKVLSCLAKRKRL